MALNLHFLHPIVEVSTTILLDISSRSFSSSSFFLSEPKTSQSYSHATQENPKASFFFVLKFAPREYEIILEMLESR